MELIVDANAFLSALISPAGKACELFFNDSLILFAPEWLLEEFEEHKAEILKKSRLSETELDLFLSVLTSRIEFIPKLEFEHFLDEAELLTPDPDDREYFALALQLNASIWTNDKKFKDQHKITIYNTTELLHILRHT